MTQQHDKDGKFFAALCQRCAEDDVIKSIIKTALDREIKENKPLQLSLVSPDDIKRDVPDEDKEDLEDFLLALQEIDSAIEEALLADSEEVAEHALELVRVMMCGFLQVLFLALSRKDRIELTDDLLIPEEFLEAECRGIYPAQIISRFAVNGDEAVQIRRIIAKKLFAESPSLVGLPLGMIIQKNQDEQGRSHIFAFKSSNQKHPVK